jgi:hypothetical protein
MTGIHDTTHCEAAAARRHRIGGRYLPRLPADGSNHRTLATRLLASKRTSTPWGHGQPALAESTATSTRYGVKP